MKATEGRGLPVSYNQGSIDGKRPGVFAINLGDITAYKRFEVPTIAMHEGNPGHNFQVNCSCSISDT